ncbi:MAG: hypothetical protein AB7K09_17725 [Planctomycetota bacterium]
MYSSRSSAFRIWNLASRELSFEGVADPVSAIASDPSDACHWFVAFNSGLVAHVSVLGSSIAQNRVVRRRGRGSAIIAIAAACTDDAVMLGADGRGRHWIDGRLRFLDLAAEDVNRTLLRRDGDAAVLCCGRQVGAQHLKTQERLDTAVVADVVGAAVQGDAVWLVTCDGQVLRWRLRSGAPQACAQLALNSVDVAALIPSARGISVIAASGQAVSAWHNGLEQTWSVAAPSAVCGMAAGSNAVVALLDEGPHMACSPTDLPTIPTGHRGGVASLLLHESSGRIVSSGYDGRVLSWDADGNCKVLAKASTAGMLCPDSRSGELIWTSLDDRLVCINVRTGEVTRAIDLGASASHGALSSNGDFICTFGTGIAKIVAAGSGQVVREYRCPHDVQACEWRPTIESFSLWSQAHGWLESSPNESLGFTRSSRRPAPPSYRMMILAAKRMLPTERPTCAWWDGYSESALVGTQDGLIFCAGQRQG